MKSDEISRLADVLARTSNRGDTHIFLGDPCTDGGDKTTVEPGNSYSPGVWSCGVSVWILVDGEWYGTETATTEQLRWGFESRPLDGTEAIDDPGADDDGRAFLPGVPPIVEALLTPVHGVTVRHLLGYETRGLSGATDEHVLSAYSEGVDQNEITVTFSREHDVVLCVVVRGRGPAGGSIRDITVNPSGTGLIINDAVHLVTDDEPTEALIPRTGVDSVGPWGMLVFDVPEERGESGSTIRFRTEHGYRSQPFGQIATSGPVPERAASCDFDAIRTAWESAVPCSIFAPDPRVGAIWSRAAFHIIQAMERGLPRIGVVNYPVFWIRDCILVLRALDLLGRSDLARIGTDYLAPLVFSGGFGAEADAPGEGIAAIARHARITGDSEWLATRYEAIKTRIAWLDRMRATDKPLFAVSENRIPRYANNPWCNLVCLPTTDGLIHGRMDWHEPDFYINCWAVAGYREAAESAKLLDNQADASLWAKRATELEERIEKGLISHFGNDRDPAVAPYPSGAFADSPERIAPVFGEWYRSNRITNHGDRIAERLWGYFEVAQAHNAMLLGFKEEAWVTLRAILAEADSWDVSAFTEGTPGGNEYLPFRNDLGGDGWLRPEVAVGGNMPHNWTSAELLAALRDMFVVESDRSLVLGAGIPREWLSGGSQFGIRNAATDLGPCSYHVTVAEDGTAHLDYHGPEQFTVAFPCEKPRITIKE